MSSSTSPSLRVDCVFRIAELFAPAPKSCNLFRRDRSAIGAGEYIDADYRGAPQRKIMITFQSKDAIGEAQPKAQPKSNSYEAPK